MLQVVLSLRAPVALTGGMSVLAVAPKAVRNQDAEELKDTVIQNITGWDRPAPADVNSLFNDVE